MKKVKNCAVQWGGLDIHAWVEYQAELGGHERQILIKDYDNLIERRAVLSPEIRATCYA